MAQNLVRLIPSEDIEFITSDEKRSPKTVENIKNSDVTILKTFREVAAKSDIVISATSPKNALTAASQYGKFTKGIYLDLNIISQCYNYILEFLSDRIGDASKLKLLRSTYTKTLSALLIESSEIARNNGLYDEFFEILSLTEGDDFREKSISRIENTSNSSKRKSEELEEIIDYFDEDELIMVKAACRKLSQ